MVMCDVWCYMLNGEFIWKWMGDKGFAFCGKWFIIFHNQFSEPIHTSQANRIHWINFPIYQFLTFILWHWIEKNIFRLATIQFYGWRFVFCAMIRREPNKFEIFNVDGGLHKTSHSWEEQRKKSWKSQQFFYLTIFQFMQLHKRIKSKSVSI